MAPGYPGRREARRRRGQSQGRKWFVCFQVELPEAEPIERPFAPVGIDIGLTSLVALSTGETVPTPQCTKNAAKALRRAQRAVARKKRHSKRQRKAKLRVARLSARVANQRRDFSHKLSRSLVDRFSHIAMEDLNIKGLAAGMLAKSVHNAAWNQLVQHVRYKAASAGAVVSWSTHAEQAKPVPSAARSSARRSPSGSTAVIADASSTETSRQHVSCSCGRTLGRGTAFATQASGLPHSCREKPPALAGGVVTLLGPDGHDFGRRAIAPAKGVFASNVLHHVSAAELKAEEMVKLPIILRGRPDPRETMSDAIGWLDELAAHAEAEHQAALA